MHQMASRQESGSAKRSKKEMVEVEDFALDYNSPLEEFDEVVNSIHPLGL